MKYNLNNFVIVTLTKRGYNVAGRSEYYPLETLPDGSQKWVLWQLMSTFGDAMYIGCEPLFESNVLDMVPPTL